ncbi:hypothetical protein BASA50_010874 [Batrachochytrium salamandrivorans]|uniref:Uncharacterized protein n=1 Tax=Batrachochytrium salamandrivorans TaxID=1357716 RepID=A0ABQ8F004_9FUNG|nr:hypothetical protein BASA50_010874 [Batrachochytrium salamandrivorans]
MELDKVHFWPIRHSVDFYEAHWGQFSNKSVEVPCRHEIKRRIEKNERFNIWRYSLSIGICMHHLLLFPVAMPCGAMFVPRKSLVQFIKLRLYEVDDDQVALLSRHVWMKQVRGHCSRFLIQRWRQSVVVQQDPHKAQGNPTRSKSLFGARDWVELFVMWSGWSQFLNMNCANI